MSGAPTAARAPADITRITFLVLAIGALLGTSLWIARPFVGPLIWAVMLVVASWGFMLPSGTGPNAIAWSTGHIALPRMLKAGFLLDLAGVPIMVGLVWAVAALAG